MLSPDQVFSRAGCGASQFEVDHAFIWVLRKIFFGFLSHDSLPNDADASGKGEGFNGAETIDCEAFLLIFI